jgi:hypothetical protein
MLSIGPIVLYGLLLLQSLWYYLSRPRKYLDLAFYFISFASVTGVVSSLLAYFLVENNAAALKLNGIQIAYAFYYLTITICWLAGINIYHCIVRSEQMTWNSKMVFRGIYVWVCIQAIITIIIFAGLYNTNVFPKLVVLNVCLIWPYLFIFGYLYLKHRSLAPTSNIKKVLFAFVILNTAALIYNSVLCFTYSSTQAVLRATYAAFFVIDFLQYLTLAMAHHFCKDLPIVANSQMMTDNGPGYTLGTVV